MGVKELFRTRRSGGARGAALASAAALLSAALTLGAGGLADADELAALSEEEAAATRARLEAKLRALEDEGDALGAENGQPGGGAAEATVAAPPPAPYPGRCGEVTIAAFSWPTARLSAQIVETALTDVFGCAVRRAPADPGRAAAAVARSNAALEATATDAPASFVIALDLAPIAPQGAALGAEIYQGRESAGWFIPDWFAAAHPDVRSLEDLKAAAKSFRARGAERPKLHICPPAWPCHADDRALIETLGLAEAFDIVTPASGDALSASMRAAWRARQPWLGAAWTPSAAVAEHPMVKLRAGALQLCRFEPSGFEPAERPERRCAAPHQTEPRSLLFPEGLETRFPELAAFLRAVSAPPERIMEGVAWRAETNAALEHAAARLLERHPQIWRDWFEPPAQRAFAYAVKSRVEAARAAAEEERSRISAVSFDAMRSEPRDPAEAEEAAQ
ncbi:MAG: glycine betaine ABC transporter substrate-binding protein [Pseudomonadota bacterium]